MQRLQQSLQERLAGWRELLLPGALIIGVVCLLRFIGLLQLQEWMALDSFARRCPAESPPERVVIVSIDETDYQSIGEFPLSNGVLAQALTTLQEYQPRVVGLNILVDTVADTAPDPDQSSLLSLMRSLPNLIVVDRAFSSDPGMNVAPPPGIPPERVGFIDSVTDADGEMRRSILAMRDRAGAVKYSLAVQLVRQYLQAEEQAEGSLQSESSARDGLTAQLSQNPAIESIDLGRVDVSKFRPNSGGYVRAEVSGYQTLIHFCALQQPFNTIPLRDLLAGRVAADRLRDRIVIIGNITTSVKDSFITSAVRETLYSQQVAGPPSITKLMYGVEVQGLATKQILSSALDRPCMLLVWPDPVEYLWIVGWGLVGIGTSVLLKSPWKSVLALAVAAGCLITVSYRQLQENWWIPLVPAMLALCGAGLATAFFDWDMRLELRQRKITVERTYEAVHNGPLQHLSVILRGLEGLSPMQLRRQLDALNTEMRNTFEVMRQDVYTGSDRLYLTSNIVLDLQQPLADLLYQVYESVSGLPLPGFANVLSYIRPNFECLRYSRFTPEQKRGLCLFLQEALINVGKYAIGATRVDVVCTAESGYYRLQVIDNGPGFAMIPPPVGEGTRQSEALAQRLGGQFQRLLLRPSPQSPRRGIVCELAWPQKLPNNRHLILRIFQIWKWIFQ
ncbi:MAG: CHASE2 domain-containing protein [Phormidesmis sp.]